MDTMGIGSNQKLRSAQSPTLRYIDIISFRSGTDRLHSMVSRNDDFVLPNELRPGDGLCRPSASTSGPKTIFHHRTSRDTQKSHIAFRYHHSWPGCEAQGYHHEAGEPQLTFAKMENDRSIKRLKFTDENMGKVFLPRSLLGAG